MRCFAGLANPLPLLLLALGLDLLLGELPPVFRLLPHPVALAGRAIGWFDHHLNRERRDEQTRRARRALPLAGAFARPAPPCLPPAPLLPAPPPCCGLPRR